MRRLVATILVASIFFWAPTVVPIPHFNDANALPPCGVTGTTWHPADTAFAISIPCAGGSSVPFYVWSIIACAGGITLAAVVATLKNNKPLTAQQATSCGLLFWFNR